MNDKSKIIEYRVHAHCVHCGDEMRIHMDKTVDVFDNDLHWLIEPCECLAEAKLQWQPIETAPKDGTAFVTYSPNNDPEFRFDIAGWSVENEEWWKWDCGFDFVTHWMLLPNPPKEHDDG